MNAAEYNKRVPCPRKYAESWAALLRLPAGAVVSVPGWVVGVAGWGTQTATAGEVLRRVRAALDARINARAGLVVRESRETEPSLRRDADAIRRRLTARVRVYQFETRQARARFGHLLASRED